MTQKIELPFFSFQKFSRTAIVDQLFPPQHLQSDRNVCVTPKAGCTVQGRSCQMLPYKTLQTVVITHMTGVSSGDVTVQDCQDCTTVCPCVVVVCVCVNSAYQLRLPTRVQHWGITGVSTSTTNCDYNLLTALFRYNKVWFDRISAGFHKICTPEWPKCHSFYTCQKQIL